ncbi:Uncharacterised protein [Mycobacteroides abscessus subsp. abscessus]|nr:Uncharacterised protein [Mycobacteroides abscessus subsp. abscessus]
MTPRRFGRARRTWNAPAGSSWRRRGRLPLSVLMRRSMLKHWQIRDSANSMTSSTRPVRPDIRGGR